jgi:hypothetical protein
VAPWPASRGIATEPDYSERFQWKGYHRIQQEEAYRFYKLWTGPNFPRVLISRLRYHEMFVPRIVERITRTAPAGADLTSWRY